MSVQWYCIHIVYIWYTSCILIVCILYIYIYIIVYILYRYAYMLYVYMHVFVFAFVCLRMCVYACIYVCTCIYVNIPGYKYTHICIYIKPVLTSSVKKMMPCSPNHHSADIYIYIWYPPKTYLSSKLSGIYSVFLNILNSKT